MNLGSVAMIFRRMDSAWASWSWPMYNLARVYRVFGVGGRLAPLSKSSGALAIGEVLLSAKAGRIGCGGEGCGGGNDANGVFDMGWAAADAGGLLFGTSAQPTSISIAA